jgi:hypothetical protein
VPLPRHILPAVVLVLAVRLAACSAASPPQSRDLAFDGPDDGELFNADTVEQLTFLVTTEGDPDVAHVDDLVVLLDGDLVDGIDVVSSPCADAAEEDCRELQLRYEPVELDDGPHTVAIGQRDPDEPEAAPEILHEWAFAIDTTPPEIELSSPNGAVVAEVATVGGALVMRRRDVD